MAAENQGRETQDRILEEEMAIERVESEKARIKTYKNIDEFLKNHAG